MLKTQIRETEGQVFAIVWHVDDETGAKSVLRLEPALDRDDARRALPLMVKSVRAEWKGLK